MSINNLPYFAFCIFYNLSDSDQISSEEFNELKKTVNIIDDEYRKKWSSTAVEEKIAYFSKSNYCLIFQDFPPLQHPLGYTLVNISLYKICNYSI